MLLLGLRNPPTMQDHCSSLQNDRFSELQDFLLFGNESPDDDKIFTTPTSTFDHDQKLRFLGKLTPKKSRVKESSKFFGVRFRTDLQKWVAEIRVAEWKSVDKKVWLGTFDTELGSARAVDAARKILKCKKKKPSNCPCVELDVYSETIPSHLNLNHIEKNAMFKEVTQFVKKKAREYATNWEPSDCSPLIPMTSSFALPTHSFNMEIDFSFDSQTLAVSSCSDSKSLSSCEALPTSSLESISISKFEDKEPHRTDLYEDLDNDDIARQPKGHSMDLMQCDNQPMVEYEARNMKLHRSWESLTSFLFEDIEDNMLLPENVLVDSECLLDNKQVFCSQEHASMDIVSKIEMLYNNCSIPDGTLFPRQAFSNVDTRMGWTLLELQLSSNSFLESFLDCAQVC